LDEVTRLSEAGHREVVLTGIHLGHYGVDWNRNQPRENWIRLAHLLRDLCEIPGQFRIRLSSIEATEVTRELISVLKDFGERIVPHLHLCLQSGSDSVLRRMRRRWGTKMFLDRCHLLRESLVNPAITTDVIVGFPGETAEEFEQTLETCRRAGFSKIHAFPFSARRGTPAAEMPNQIEKSIKSQRVASLTELETELRKDYFRNLVGSELEMLVESTRQLAPSTTILASSSNHRSQIALEEPTSNDILLRGTSCRYAPVESIIGSTDGTEVAVGDLVRVQINKSDGEKLHGTVISS